jgi:hypothetical protein
MTCREFLYTCKYRLWIYRPQEKKMTYQTIGVDLWAKPIQLEKGFHFGREREPLPRMYPVDRFDPQPVASYEQRPIACIVDRESEHPIEPSETVFTPFLIRAKHDFSIRLRPEPIALSLELGPDLRVVIDLSVIRDPE